MPRFAVLEHDWPSQHWDFLLEAGLVLKTWRLLSQPIQGIVIAAEAIGDHRLLYLDYEGEISGGRGRVSRWDAGDFNWLQDACGIIIVDLQGAKLIGRAEIGGGEFRWD